MSPRLANRPLISRSDLERLGDARLREARVLLEAGCFAGAVYLGGYSSECYLKAAIGHRLGWNQLIETFETHDLEGLLAYTGLERELRSSAPVHLSFMEIVGLWNGRGGEPQVRYEDPRDVDEPSARSFIRCLTSASEGMIPWLQRAIS